MISLEPSKMRFTRMSRIACSTGTGFSPLAFSDSAVSYPRPPRTCMSSSITFQASSEPYTLHSAASMRMSLRLSSASRAETSSIASSPNALPAMNASFCATASCLPIGRPHCTRSVAHSRATLVAHFEAPTEIAISAKRPVFSVLSAIRRPSPSRAIRFSSGTKTSLRTVTEFSIPRRPMNALRCRTVIPSLS